MIRGPVQIYRVKKLYNLLWLNAAVGGINGDQAILRLLIDTGSSSTIFPVEPLISLGYKYSASTARKDLLTANGLVKAPCIQISWFNCLGQRVDNFQAVLYDIPAANKFDGLLGMDFLEKYRAYIATGNAEIYLPIPQHDEPDLPTGP